MSLSATGNTLLDQYVNSYINTQMYRYDPYDLKAEQLEKKQTFFTQLNSRLNTLLSIMDRFGTYKNVKREVDGEEVTNREFVKANNVDSLFQTRKVSTSNNDFLTATAKGTALTGLNNVKVLQLASTDSYIGKRVDISNQDTLSQNLLDKIDPDTGKGSVKFKVNINGESKEFNIEFSDSDTNESLMKKIVNEVNKGGEGTINDKLNAAFVKDTTGTARLTFTSKTTGEQNAISFEVAPEDEDITGIFGITNTASDRTVYNDDAPDDSFGFIQKDAGELNARVNVNGVTIVRGTNSINDAIDGITLNLKKVHSASDAATTLNTEIDTQAVLNLIDPLIQSFNNISNYITTNKDAHGKDPAMVGLSNTLRGLVSESLFNPANAASVKSNANYSNADTVPIQYLAELGFTMGSDGVLKLSDTEKFNNILMSDDGAKLIADAITGFSNKVSQYMDNLTARDSNQGLIKSRLSSISQQIDANNKKIASIDSQLEKMEASVRKQYTAYLSAYYNAQNQAALLSTFSTNSGGAYDSLVSQQATSNNR